MSELSEALSRLSTALAVVSRETLYRGKTEASGYPETIEVLDAVQQLNNLLNDDGVTNPFISYGGGGSTAVVFAQQFTGVTLPIGPITITSVVGLYLVSIYGVTTTNAGIDDADAHMDSTGNDGGTAETVNTTWSNTLAGTSSGITGLLEVGSGQSLTYTFTPGTLGATVNIYLAAQKLV